MYTCYLCVYKKACGDSSRTVPCAGRKTKKQVKEEQRAEKRKLVK